MVEVGVWRAGHEDVPADQHTKKDLPKVTWVKRVGIRYLFWFLQYCNSPWCSCVIHTIPQSPHELMVLVCLRFFERGFLCTVLTVLELVL